VFDQTKITAYFANKQRHVRRLTKSAFFLGVAVGTITEIEPQPQRSKVTFPLRRPLQGARRRQAVILSPSLVTSRAIQLTPAYTSGPSWPVGR